MTTYRDIVAETPHDTIQWKGSQLAALREVLTPLYPTIEHRNRLARDINLTDALFAREDANHLHLLLTYAASAGKVGALLATVERDYPDFVRPPWPTRRNS